MRGLWCLKQRIGKIVGKIRINQTNIGGIELIEGIQSNPMPLPEALRRVVEFPAVSTEVLEAGDIAAEVWALLEAAGGTECVLEVGVNLNLLGELGSLDLDEGGGDGPHVSAAVVEGHAPRSHGVLELVRVHTFSRKARG